MKQTVKAVNGRECFENNSLTDPSQLRAVMEEILDKLKFKLIEFTVSRHHGSARIRAVIYNGESISIDDCSKVHRTIMPRLELAFAGQDVYLEVSSPGIDRIIKEKSEYAYYTGRVVRCYRVDISDWTEGILQSVDEEGIVLETKDTAVKLKFDIIAKARLQTNALVNKRRTLT